MNKNIPNYDGLYGDVASRYLTEYLFLELIETRSQTFDWVIHPHIHTHLFQVFIVQNGQVSFQEATQIVNLGAPCLFFIPPTNLHGLTYTPDVKGYILTISDHIIEDIFKTSPASFKSLDKIQTFSYTDKSLAFDDLIRTILQIEEELFGEQPERMLILKAYLTQFFIKLHRIVKQDEEIKTDNLQMNYFRNFQRNIKQSEYPKSIPTFAEELNITTVHLNRICQAIAGKSALALVQQHLISDTE